ncbi:orotate phosphoribosyltransferase [Cardiosporidium cionae]|uniref:orotate phosphoribosyltransferase n=1 Tax=Cardiosporidium cionae TaxID=476202 RepID=A0ABQ7JCD2_9APIC|nr:orotate phosphoribosyltransferase [Cardiosporidium cionae]|eukprot:KAF8821305.1 orotate phosphoribosyltransferase [Cardiosporidium cionae]
MMAELLPWKQDFLQSAESRGVLAFGSFKLKSERISPYFFNLGNFSDGEGFEELCQAYAKAISESKIEFDVLFGPAYKFTFLCDVLFEKGIPLVAGVTLALYNSHGLSFPFCYNRKEVKDHGEGGWLVGAKNMLKEGTRVLLVDDVITAGTAVQQAIELLRPYKCTIAGLMIGLDREEHMTTSPSIFWEHFNFPVIHVLNATDIIRFLEIKIAKGIVQRDGKSYECDLKALLHYRDKYGKNINEPLPGTIA